MPVLIGRPSSSWLTLQGRPCDDDLYDLPLDLDWLVASFRAPLNRGRKVGRHAQIRATAGSTTLQIANVTLCAVQKA